MKILSLIGILLSIIGMFICNQLITKQLLFFNVFCDLAKDDPITKGIRKLCFLLMTFFVFFLVLSIKTFLESKKH